MEINHDDQTFLTFRVGSMLCCAPMTPVVSIIDNADHYQLPSTHGRHAMMVRYESDVAGLIDLHEKLGLPRPETHTDTCLIIIRLRGELLALWADEALDILKPPHDHRWAGGEPATWFPHSPFDRVLVVQDKMVLHTDFERLVAMKNVPPNWLAGPKPRAASPAHTATVTTATRPVPTASNTRSMTSATRSPVADSTRHTTRSDRNTTDLQQKPASTVELSRAAEQQRPTSQAIERMIAARQRAQQTPAPKVMPRPPTRTAMQTTQDRPRIRAVPTPAPASNVAVLPAKRTLPRHVLLSLLLILLAVGSLSYYTLYSAGDDMGAERPATASNSAPAQSAPTTGRAAPTTTAALQWDLDDVTITVERAGEFQEQNNASADLAGRAAPTVHTVVAGDTLWAIAERYLGDPYRYPSLARHSDIRNPHLIRPGDRVVIQRKASQQ